MKSGIFGGERRVKQKGGGEGWTGIRNVCLFIYVLIFVGAAFAAIPFSSGVRAATLCGGKLRFKCVGGAFKTTEGKQEIRPRLNY